MAHSKSWYDDYVQVRTVPGLLTVAAILAALYSFGGISEFTLTWVSYTITTEHALIVGLASYIVAFASSATKRFENYEIQEQMAIAAGPAAMLANEYLPEVSDWVTNSDPLGGAVLFVVFLGGWVVAIQ